MTSLRCTGCVGHEHRLGPMEDCALIDCTCPVFDPAAGLAARPRPRTEEFEPTCPPVHGCPDCKWRSVPDGQGGGDGEFDPCEKHAALVDLADVIENGWPDVATYGSEPF